MEEKRSFPFGLWLAVYAVAASLLALSNLFALHKADSLIYTLGSLDHWSPYFWEQDRVGMLIPLLISPVRNPFANLVVQTGFTAFLGLGVPLVLARLLLPTATGALAAVLANAWILFAGTPIMHENLYIFTMYPLGLFLGLTGLLVLEGSSLWRWLLAFTLISLGMWNYVAIVIVLFPLALVLTAIRCENPRRLRSWLGASAPPVIVLTAFLAGYALMKWGHDIPPFYPPTSNEMMPLKTWDSNLKAFGKRICEEPGGVVWLAVSIAAVPLGLTLTAIRRDWRTLRVAGVLLVLIAVELVFGASRKWVVIGNLSNVRYILFSVSALPVAAFVMLLAPLSRWLDRRPWLVLLAGLVILPLAVFERYDTPSVSRCRAIVDERFGEHSEAILECGAPALGGHYWTLWTTYYHVKLLKYERGDTTPLVPVGWRTWPYREEWQALKTPFVVAVPRGTFKETDLECVRRGLEPLTKIGECGSVDLYLTQPQVK